jgi:ubiquitin thioesterase OTU1
MAAKAMFRLKYNRQTFELSTILSTTVKDLMNEIKLLTDVMPSRQVIQYGFPPKTMPTDAESLDLTMEMLGIKKREMFTLTTKDVFEKTIDHQKSSILSCEKYPIQADNSCLFATISYLCTGSVNQAYSLRQHCIKVIRENPDKFDEATLGSFNAEYCKWLSDPQHWGGYIEMDILSKHFNVEICVLYIEDGQIVPVNSCGAKKRIYILYDNIHYDAVIFKCFGEPKERFIVNSDDGKALELATEMMSIIRTAGGFTNTKKATYQCDICGTVCKGSKEADAHARATGHINFSQAV